MRTNNSIQYSFLVESFNYLIALNRGLTLEKDDKERVLESSFIRLSRLLYYSQLPNDYARVDHELHFIEYYLEQQSLRYQGKIQYKIDSNYQSTHWAIRKLELYRLLDKMIMDCAEEPICDLAIQIDASNLKYNKGIVTSTNHNAEHSERTLKVRKMKPSDSRFYMLDLPILKV